ncbi:ROK family transcriptional regulator [Nitrospirillum viridazoti]|uniref:Transcriptional regulator n=1 Tax=Nitrospirillum viridazoti CBAmc TaxID=1441467 RepID=A0A248K378_9PROT|nr:ROK family transcriptional regulator [Nitrospirillum amazonense]ASG25216.1 transcriptional regulator [Nitrospirillum amazonense CBAmc]TWB35285.1 putative NBD/HSP70 family sugar kinase [Nitrospirillum amazonense]
MVSVARPVSEGGRRILDLLLKSGGLSQAELTRSLDLSQPTVTRLLQGFHQDGLVRTAARQADRPGHPSVHVSLNPDFAYALGVSLLGDAVSMTLMDFTGKVRGLRRAAMPTMARPVVLERLRAFRRELEEETGIDPRRLVGVGVGISAFYVGRGRLFNPPAYLDDWAMVEIEPILEEALRLPVRVDNDGTVAAIGESLFGVGRRCRNFAYLHLTNGFGGGIIADGKPFRGQNGNAGEFGGIWTLAGVTYANLDLLQTCLKNHGHVFATVEEMVQAIDAGWDGVADWLDQARPSFAMLCGLLAYSMDPGLIVIGGRLPPSIAQALAERIVVPVPTNRRGYPPPLPAVVVAEAPGDPVALGAAVMPLREAFFA